MRYAKSHIVQRGRVYHFWRRVPRKYANLDPRVYVKISLETDSRDVARIRAALIDVAVEDFWRRRAKREGDCARAKLSEAVDAARSSDVVAEGLRRGPTVHQSDEAHLRFRAAVETARSFGLAYRSVEELASGRLDDLVERLDVVAQHGIDDPVVVNAVLGGVDRPFFTWKSALEEYWSLAEGKTLTKNKDQLRRWKNPRIKAVDNLIGVLGSDRPLASTRREDALDFRRWWLDRLRDEGLTPNSANKDIGHVSQILRTVNDAHRLGIDSTVFAGLRIDEREPEERAPFESDYVMNVLLDSRRLMTLNEEGRWLIFAMADTGAGISELCGLNPEEIVLDGAVPFVHIRVNKNRELKTPFRSRKVPLVGAALVAFKNLPNGFEKYRERATSLSTVVNKYLRENELLPSPQHSLYSLRHTFQERMNAIHVPDQAQAELMGHKFYRPKYGRPIPLEEKQRWLEEMAFRV